MKTGNPSDLAIKIQTSTPAAWLAGARYVTFQVLTQGVFAQSMVAENLIEIFGPAAMLTGWNYDTNAGEFFVLPGNGLTTIAGETFRPVRSITCHPAF